MSQLTVSFRVQSYDSDERKGTTTEDFVINADEKVVREAFNKYFGKGKTEVGTCLCALNIVKGGYDNTLHITGTAEDDDSIVSVLTALSNVRDELSQYNITNLE